MITNQGFSCVGKGTHPHTRNTNLQVFSGNFRGLRCALVEGVDVLDVVLLPLYPPPPSAYLRLHIYQFSFMKFLYIIFLQSSDFFSWSEIRGFRVGGGSRTGREGGRLRRRPLPSLPGPPCASPLPIVEGLGFRV